MDSQLAVRPAAPETLLRAAGQGVSGPSLIAVQGALSCPLEMWAASRLMRARTWLAPRVWGGRTCGRAPDWAPRPATAARTSSSAMPPCGLRCCVSWRGRMARARGQRHGLAVGCGWSRTRGSAARGPRLRWRRCGSAGTDPGRSRAPYGRRGADAAHVDAVVEDDRPLSSAQFMPGQLLLAGSAYESSVHAGNAAFRAHCAALRAGRGDACWRRRRRCGGTDGRHHGGRAEQDLGMPGCYRCACRGGAAEQLGDLAPASSLVRAVSQMMVMAGLLTGCRHRARVFDDGPAH
jgi:hypothetical protein